MKTEEIKEMVLIKNERGLTLIEVLIATALLGIIVVAFFGALSVASKARFIADERATAESLVRSQIEYVKRQPYKDASPGDHAIYTKMPDIPGGYTIWSVDRDSETKDIVGIPWNLDPERGPVGPVNEDVGFQRTEVVVKHHGKEVLRLAGFRVKL